MSTILNDHVELLSNLLQVANNKQFICMYIGIGSSIIHVSLGPVYELVCISFRTGNLNCFRVNMKYVPKPESGAKVLKMTLP